MAEEKIGLRFVVDGRGAAVGAMGSVRSSLVSVRGAALATGAAVFGVAHALSSSVEEAREAERVGKVTQARLKSTGHAANVTSKQIGNLANAISKKAGVDDEAIQSGENLLLTFTNIRNEQGKGNKIFNQATQAATDLSAAMAGTNSGLDLKSASIQVGKALNDPIKGVAALGRVGVSFDDQQKALIKTLVESGRTMAAQKIILGELRKEFGGTAAAQATMGDKVSVAWGNIEEQLGTALLPLLDEVERAFLRKGVPAIQHYLDVFQKDGVPTIRHFVDDAKPLAEEVLPAIGTGFRTMADALKTAAPYAKDIVGAFNDLPDDAKKAILLGGGAAMLAFKARGLFGGAARVATGGSISKYGIGVTPVYVVNMGPGGVPGGPAAEGAGIWATARKFLLSGAGASLVGDALPFARMLPIPLPAFGSQVIKPGDKGMRGIDLPLAITDPDAFKRSLDKSALAADAVRQELVDLGVSTARARDRAEELWRSLDRIREQPLSLNATSAENELMRLRQMAEDTATAVAAAASGLLFGGSAPSAPTRSPKSHGPRVPSVPTTKPPILPGGNQRATAGARSADPIVLQVNLDGKVIAENTIHHLGDREARR